MSLRIALVCICALAVCAPLGAEDTLTRFDFEDGTLQGWTIVSGEAGQLPTPDTARPNVRFNQHGDYFIGLYENPAHDAATTELKSPTFTVNADTISLLVGGGRHPNACYVALYDASDDTEIARETGLNGEAMNRRYWDVSALKGKRVYVKVVDSHTGGWGHLNVDDIREMSPEDEQARAAELAEKQASYQRWLASVDAPSKRIVYAGEALADVAMPLGGIGGGHISICGDGAIRQWQVFGAVNDGCVVPDSFFAIWAKSGHKQAVAKALQQTAIESLPPVEKVEFIGEYPIAEIKYHDSSLPVVVSLRAFSPHIPMNPKDSAIPAAIFEFTIQNRGIETVECCLLSTLQNAAGYDGRSAIYGVWNTRYGGNVNTATSFGSYRGVRMHNPLLDLQDRHYGSMSVGAIARNADITPQWSDLQKLWSTFSRYGTTSGVGESGPSKPGRTWNAAVTVPLTLEPGQKMTVPFIWSWHFPNHFVWWDGREGQPKIGRMYSNWFEDANNAAEYLASNYARLAADTDKFRRTFYKTTLPYWMLDRISAQSSTLASNVAMWIEDGSFVCFEGAGCCPMNCAHVWNYEQQLAYLFPTLERNMRRIDLEVQQDENGAVRHRTRLPLSLPRQSGPFVDGHLGTILKSYREYRQSSDGKWLDRMWPRIKLAMQFVLNEWDPNQDGVLVNEQWNTYDAAMYGPNTFIGTLYLCALRASEEMAKVQHDSEFAAKTRSVFETGSKQLDDVCWNGEYYWQIEAKPTEEEVGANTWLLEDWPTIRDEPRVNRPYGKGCHADQLLGQWWANILDLGYLLPKERVNAALDSIMKYNWVTDFGEVAQTPRAFAGALDPGLYNCTWPRGGQPEHVTLYSFEVWTGIEYEVAGLLLYEGREREARQIVKAASDRYNGVARPPIPRNPWAEVECGNHYARAMASWSILLSAQGYNYCGPEQALEFDPVVSPSDHASFFTTAEGWGLFSQKRSARSQANTLEVEYGTCELKSLSLHLPESAADPITVTVKGSEVDFTHTVDGDCVRIEFTEPIQLNAGEALRAAFEWD